MHKFYNIIILQQMIYIYTYNKYHIKCLILICLRTKKRFFLNAENSHSMNNILHQNNNEYV